MKYALIGCGRIAPNHIKAAKSNGLEFVAFCDIDVTKINQMLEKAQCPNLINVPQYENYKIMLDEHPELELVAIATESGCHASIAQDCIDAGLNLIIEKPIAMSIADANLIINAAEKANVKVCTCHQNRFNYAIVQLKKAIDENRFGRLSHGAISIRWNRNHDYYAQAAWRGTWSNDGGTLMNQCIHGIDLLRWIMGDEPEEVFGYTRQRFHNYIEAEDVGVAVVSFKNGSIGTIEGTANTYPKNLEETLSIFGENGTVRIGGVAANSIDIWEFADTQTEDSFIRDFSDSSRNVYGIGHSALYADAIEAIRQNKSPLVDAIAGKKALEMVLAIYKSQLTRMPVRLPLSDFSAIEMSKALL